MCHDTSPFGSCVCSGCIRLHRRHAVRVRHGGRLRRNHPDQGPDHRCCQSGLLVRTMRAPSDCWTARMKPPRRRDRRRTATSRCQRCIGTICTQRCPRSLKPNALSEFEIEQVAPDGSVSSRMCRLACDAAFADRELHDRRGAGGRPPQRPDQQLVRQPDWQKQRFRLPARNRALGPVMLQP